MSREHPLSIFEGVFPTERGSHALSGGICAVFSIALRLLQANLGVAQRTSPDWQLPRFLGESLPDTPCQNFGNGR